MDILLIWTSFLAGLLTVLAPCVLPLLPVIIGGTIGTSNPWRPVVITTALASSIVIFTLLLKASTIFFAIPQETWRYVSGGIVLAFGFFMLLPRIWDALALKFHFGSSSHGLLQKAGTKHSLWGAVLLGAALGPVFSSCSPTYFVILATILPVSFAAGVFYLIIYAASVALILGLIAYFGQRLTAHLRWAADPRGWFKRGLGILLILVGLAVMTGYDKKIETAILDLGYGVTSVEESLLEKMVDQDAMQISATTNEPTLTSAPELVGLTNWLNGESITSMEELRGKVVLIDFWTYSCINCIRTLPSLQSWHEKYADQGLVVIGVHAPEFQFEKKAENVAAAVKEFGLTYPVVQDNDFMLWRAYNNRYWPAKYLIDQDGYLRYHHFGEGKYEETEAVIVDLLGATKKSGDVSIVSVPRGKVGTPETYMGTARRSHFVASADRLEPNEWTLAGMWQHNDENIMSTAPDASVRFNFTASKANLVISGRGMVEVLVDGTRLTEHAGRDVQDGVLTLDSERLYELTDFGDIYETHEIELRFHESDVALYAWTFG